MESVRKGLFVFPKILLDYSVIIGGSRWGILHPVIKREQNDAGGSKSRWQQKRLKA